MREHKRKINSRKKLERKINPGRGRKEKEKALNWVDSTKK